MPPRGLLLCALAALAAAEDDPTDVLVRLRDQVTEHGQRIPNHLCVGTIQRDRFQPKGSLPKSCDGLLARRKRAGAGALLKAGTMDRIRLDVAMADTAEIYSWPGANTFTDRDGDVFRLIPSGSMGTGPFAGLLLSIFNPSTTHFFYDGATRLGDRQLMQYSFTVPRGQSDYKAKTPGGWWITGYTGTLLVEPRTGILVHLTIRTDELPPETSVCEVDTTLDYSTVQLNGLGYLLPTGTHQRFISPDGSEAENSITFGACREYVGAPDADGKPQPGTLPVDLPVLVDLTAGVALDQAAAGDRIQGRLAAPIVDQQQRKMLVPAGSMLYGRLMRVETHYSVPRNITVVLRWETIDIQGVETLISLNPVRPRRGEITSNGPLSLGGIWKKGREADQPLTGEERYATFQFHGDNAVMKSGLRSDWVTTQP